MTLLPPISACPHCGIETRTHIIESGFAGQAAEPVEVITEPKPKPIAAERAHDDPDAPAVFILSLFWHLHYPQCRKMKIQGIGRKVFETLGPLMVQRIGNCIGEPTQVDFEAAVSDPDCPALPPFQKLMKSPAAE